MKDDWSLKDKHYPWYDGYGSKDIETLRQKLIEDVVEILDVENTNKIISRINKRFGVDK